MMGLLYMSWWHLNINCPRFLDYFSIGCDKLYSHWWRSLPEEYLNGVFCGQKLKAQFLPKCILHLTLDYFMPKSCVPTNIRSIDLYYRYIFGLWSVLHVDIYFQQVLRSELYCCLYSIMTGYSCLAPVHPPPLSPRIHILEECLVLLVGGNNVFKLGYSWQNVAMIWSQLIT